MREPLERLESKRIALIKPSALGDIVHSLPVLTALRQRYPTAHITWIVNRSYEPLLAGHPDLDATLAFDRGMFRGNWLNGGMAFMRFLMECRRRRFDLVVDLQGLLRSGIMTLATGAARRLGFANAREGARFAYTDLLTVPELEDTHAVDRYWLAAEALGAGHMDKVFRVPIGLGERAETEMLLKPLPRPWIFLGVGARWRTKRWPPAHFTTLASRAAARHGGSVVLIGGRDEIEPARETAQALTCPILDMTGKTTLPLLSALLARADVLIANDTGPLHLAAALGRPVVAPFLCTKARWTGPYGSLDTAIESKVWCQGSCVKQCDRLECMDELVPDRLWPALQGILETWQSRCA